VAVVAVIAAINVCRVLASCRDAVMAGAANAHNLRVVDSEYGREHICVVTVLAHVGRLNVRRTFARGFRAVVAVDAVTGDVDVIEVSGQPAGGRVTVVASVAAGDVGWILAGRGKTIMAGATSTRNLRMVDSVCRRKRVGVVTIFADGRSRNVRCVLASSISAIVAVAAISDDIDVIEIGRYPTGRRMAVVAVIATVQVSRVFAGCRDAIMAGAAGANDLRVVNSKHRRPDVRVVAVLAHIACSNVARGLAGCLHTVMAARAVAGDIHVIEICGEPADRRVAVVAVSAARDVSRVFACRRDTVVT